MADFQDPPTYASPVLMDEQSGVFQFNPLWLNWFIQLVSFINSAGGVTPNHNALPGLQGGTSSEFYHLTAAQHAAATAASFESGEIAIGGLGTTTTAAHGLGVVPDRFTVSLRCKTAEFGYAVGDETTTLPGYTVTTEYADATNVGIVHAGAGNIHVIDRGTFNTSAITNGSWRYIFRAWV